MMKLIKTFPNDALKQKAETYICACTLCGQTMVIGSLVERQFVKLILPKLKCSTCSIRKEEP